MKSHQPASAHICGVALLNGVSSVQGKPRTILLEATFWNGQEPILGLFRYFNGSPGIEFEVGEKYFICSSVGSYHSMSSPVRVLTNGLFRSLRLSPRLLRSLRTVFLTSMTNLTSWGMSNM